MRQGEIYWLHFKGVGSEPAGRRPALVVQHDRFNRSAAGMTYELADDLLASRNVEEELRRRYRSCLEQCDFARFVPASSQAERRIEVLDEAAAIVDRLEKAL